MSRDCSVCAHLSRREIDAALIQGRSARDVAASFDLGWQAVNRHRINHLPLTIRRQAREALERADNTVSVHQEARETQASPVFAPHAEASPGRSVAAPARIPADAVPPASPMSNRRRGIELGDAEERASGATVAPAAPSTHAAPGSAPAPSAAPTATLFNAYEQAVDLRSRAMNILAQAERDADLKTALMAIREARGVLDHLVRLQERQGGGAAAVPLVQSEEWVRTRTAIVAALAEFPEARIAVAEALVSVGAMP